MGQVITIDFSKKVRQGTEYDEDQIRDLCHELYIDSGCIDPQDVNVPLFVRDNWQYGIWWKREVADIEKEYGEIIDAIRGDV